MLIESNQLDRGRDYWRQCDDELLIERVCHMSRASELEIALAERLDDLVVECAGYRDDIAGLEELVASQDAKIEKLGAELLKAVVANPESRS